MGGAGNLWGGPSTEFPLGAVSLPSELSGVENLPPKRRAQAFQESLVSRIQTRCLQSATEIAQVSPLFHLDEKTQQDLLRGTQVIQAATACMERVLCEKRYRSFLDLWEQTDPINEPENSQLYYQSLYAAQRRLQELDLMRQFCLTDLL